MSSADTVAHALARAARAAPASPPLRPLADVLVCLELRPQGFGQGMEQLSLPVKSLAIVVCPTPQLLFRVSNCSSLQDRKRYDAPHVLPHTNLFAATFAHVKQESSFCFTGGKQRSSQLQSLAISFWLGDPFCIS